MEASKNSGVVAAGHQETANAATEVLSLGGNAMDAAVAGVFASFTAEPVLTSLFGGGLLTVMQPDGSAQCLDFFSCVPGLGGPGKTEATDFVSVMVDFGPTVQEFVIGRGSAAVPGNLAGLLEAHRRWGSISLEALMEPAADLAVRGAKMTPQMAWILTLLKPILMREPEVREQFAPKGELLVAGELYRNPELGDLLRKVSREGGEGPTVRDIHQSMLSSFGPEVGLVTERDLQESKPVLREPLRVKYRGAELVVPPPPVLGASLVALGLELLEGRPRYESGSLEAALSIAEVLRSMTEARFEEPAEFLEAAAINSRRQAIEASLSGLTAGGSTTHISVIDSAGMAVGITSSNGEGCGTVVPGTGVMMNNFLGEADINPSGFHKQAAGTRMLTMMCPSILRMGDTTMVLGTGGSNRIRSAVLQVVDNLVAHSQPIQEAVDAPRIHVEGSVVNLEVQGRSEETIEKLGNTCSELIRFEEPNMFFGGVHVARTGPEGFAGAGDVRRGGSVSIV